MTVRTELDRGLWLLPLAALLPLILYIALGYGGQDFSFHAASWLELHNSWRAHEWELGWAQWAQFGFGEPRFCFYPPLSFLLGGALSFLLPFRWVPGVVVWLLLTVSGGAMYLAAGQLLGPERRLRAALLYMFNPYLLVTIMLRFAIAEAWVQAILPLSFLCFYRASTEGHRRAAVLLAGLFACGWLTNIPEAIAVFYTFAAVAVALALRARSLRPLLPVLLAQAFSLALAAFRLLPAFVEQAWIHPEALLHYDYRAYLRPWKLPPPHTLTGICAAFAVCAFFFTWAGAAGAGRRALHANTLLPLCLLTMASFVAFVQLPLAAPFWAFLPEFKFVLFPFRFLPFLSLAVVFALHLKPSGATLRRAASAVLVLLAMAPMFAFTRLLPFQRFSSIGASALSWQGGLEGVREYVPAGVPETRAEPDVERSLAKGGPFASPDCTATLVGRSPNARLIRVGKTQGCVLTLKTFYYPFWRASLPDHSPLPVRGNREGLLTVSVPPGVTEFTLRFMPATRTRTAANILSLLSFLVWLGALARSPRRTAATRPQSSAA